MGTNASRRSEYGEVVAPASGAPEPGTRSDQSTDRLARVLGSVGQFCTVSGIVTLMFVVYQLWGTSVQEAQAQEGLRDDFEERLEDFINLTDPVAVVTPSVSDGAADGTTQLAQGSDSADASAAERPDDAPVAASGQLPQQVRELLFPEGGEDIARIEIPSIGVDKIVVEGVSVDDLRKGPGRYQRSVLPGEPGNTAFAGHRTTYGAPFHNIDNLVPGDEIHVTSLLGEFTYRVMGQTEKDRVGFCVADGHRPAEEEQTDARALRGEPVYDPTLQTPDTTTTTLPSKDLPENFAVGAIDGMTFFATTDISSELQRAAQVEAEAALAEEELVVAAAEGVGRGAFDGIVDQPAELGHFIVAPSDTCVLDDWGDNRITLTACHPKFSARQRIIVVAELVGEPAAPVSRPESIGGVAGTTDGLGVDEFRDADDSSNNAADTTANTAADDTSGDTAGDAAGDAAGTDSDDVRTGVAATGSDDTGSTGGSDIEAANTVAADTGLDAGLGWDTSVLPQALMWGALTIAGYLLTQFAARRWHKWPAWAIGAVPVGFLLFLSFEQLDRLLPAY